MFCARLQAAGSVSETSVHATGVVPKEEKGYADSAALIERPDFDWRKDQAERENSISLRWSRNRW
jgi:hypothetical protein